MQTETGCRMADSSGIFNQDDTEFHNFFMIDSDTLCFRAVRLALKFANSQFHQKFTEGTRVLQMRDSRLMSVLLKCYLTTDGRVLVNTSTIEFDDEDQQTTIADNSLVQHPILVLSHADNSVSIGIENFKSRRHAISPH